MPGGPCRTNDTPVCERATAAYCWYVYEDIYLSQFTFARYAMWADVKNNIKLYYNTPCVLRRLTVTGRRAKGAYFSSLSSSCFHCLMSNANKLGENKLEAANEDNGNPCDVLVPLPCDSTQYAAVARSQTGVSFVLHGPPA